MFLKEKFAYNQNRQPQPRPDSFTSPNAADPRELGSYTPGFPQAWQGQAVCLQHPAPEKQHSQLLKDTTQHLHLQKRRWALASLQIISSSPASPQELLSIFHPNSYDTKHS